MMVFVDLPESEVKLIADWIDRSLERQMQDDGNLTGETPATSGRIIVAATEIVRSLRQELAYRAIRYKNA